MFCPLDSCVIPRSSDTPAERQRKAEVARAAAVQRSIQLQLTGQKAVSSSSSSSTTKPSSSSSSSTSSSSSSASASSAPAQPSLADLHAQRVRDEKRAKRAEVDPRFAHLNPALLAPEWDREKEFGGINLDAKPKQSIMLNQSSALSDRFASAGKTTSFL